MPLIPPPNLQRSGVQSSSWQLSHRLWLLTVAIFWWVASPALANPLADYCVKRFTQEPGLPSAAQSLGEEPAQVTFKVKEKTFQVVASYDQLLLIQRNNSTPLSQMPVPQRESIHIRDLKLGKDGWLWIGGHEIDYMAPLDLQQLPPTLGPPVALPELMRKPCISLIWHLLRACPPAQSSYSITLNRAFVTGHRITLLGWPDLVSFEIVAGKAKPLPVQFRGARFEVDVPKVNGSLLRGPAGEALFYDGSSIIPLRPADVTPGGWTVETFASGQTYLRRGPNRQEHQPFLMELKAGPTLVPIPLSEKWLNCHAVCACGW